MKLIILDHDVVINNYSNIITKSSVEWTPIQGSIEAISYLNQMGYRIVVASNRSCDKKIIDMPRFNSINDRMCKAVNQAGGRIDAIFLSPQSNTKKYNRSKLLSIMFEEVTQRFGVDINNVFIVGDNLRYLKAAASSGALPILVLTGKGGKIKSTKSLPKNTRIFSDLASVVDTLVK
ncbi:MAG: D-glycero-beta-D-manno-heptose-1,7-bisphosphate 7-phosphatase [Nitrosomonadaceae bacterium]|nr:D-glycero-beta-D-manno-heptose-1,7-bisphosphate 7-phosphatase [Nitrosomonadaceae bacterium]|tara:strand:- start:276 stop:806 length:531 start_codon:yes stop_codon:yes gene_type:complete